MGLELENEVQGLPPPPDSIFLRTQVSKGIFPNVVEWVLYGSLTLECLRFTVAASTAGADII